MKLNGNFTFEAPQDVAWKTLMDTEVLRSVLPGCEKLEPIGENQYEGVMNVKVGPVQSAFKAKIELRDINEPDSYEMLVDGTGAAGFVKASGNVSLEPEAGNTKLTYTADAQVGGRVASVGQRLLDSSAKAITRQSLIALNEVMKQRAARSAAGDSGPPPEPVVVDQSQLARNVAREVASEMVPPWARLLLIVIGLIVVLAVVFRLLR